MLSSASLSTSNAAAALFSKQVNEFLKGGEDEAKGYYEDEREDEEGEEDSEVSLEKSAASGVGEARLGSINAMYEKYKRYQALLAKYSNAAGEPQKGVGGSGDFDDSSVTISKSQ